MIKRANFSAALLLCGFAASAASPDAAVYGPELQGFEYPYPVKAFDLTSQG